VGLIDKGPWTFRASWSSLALCFRSSCVRASRVRLSCVRASCRVLCHRVFEHRVVFSVTVCSFKHEFGHCVQEFGYRSSHLLCLTSLRRSPIGGAGGQVPDLQIWGSGPVPAPPRPLPVPNSTPGPRGGCRSRSPGPEPGSRYLQPCGGRHP